MTKVILDTSAILASSRDLKSPAFESLIVNAGRFGYELVVPQVVLVELSNRFRRELEEHFEKSRQSTAAFARATGYEISEVLTEELVRLGVHDYEQRIAKRLSLDKENVLDYPTVDHKTLVSMDVAGRKPFSNSRESYRDALIWFSIIDAIRHGARKVIFITSNWKDFASASSQTETLQQDLIEQLATYSIQPEQIELFNSIEDFHKVVIVPLLDKADAYLPGLLQGMIGEFDVINHIRMRLDAGLRELIPLLNPLLLSVPTPVTGLIHGGVSDIELSEQQLQRITDTELWISTRVHFRTELTAIADPNSRLAKNALALERLSHDFIVADLTRPGVATVEMIVTIDPAEVTEFKIVLLQIGKWAIGNTNLSDVEFFKIAASSALGFGDTDETRWLENTGFQIYG